MVSRQVYYFLVLYEELNFTRAARRCSVSQPSLTNGIQTLERWLGGRLFHRERSSQLQVRPTELADAIRPHLQQIADSARGAKASADEFRVKRHPRAPASMFPHPRARI